MYVLEQQLSIIRGEVLRQLIGTAFSWVLPVLTVVIGYLLVRLVFDWTVDGTLGRRLRQLGRVFSEDPAGLVKVVDYDKERAVGFARLGFFAFFLLVLGYYLGYYINASYVSGEITLITTVGRITNFYKLVATVVECLFFLLSFIVLMTTARRVSLVGTEKYSQSKAYKVSRGLLALFKWLGILSVLVLAIASIVVCYISIQ